MTLYVRTATTILAAVQKAISAHAATRVTIVGHSLGERASYHYALHLTYTMRFITGAAIALLDGVYLPLHISGVSFRVIGYGMPRVRISSRRPSYITSSYFAHYLQVGNQAFADYVDAHLSLTHINNRSGSFKLDLPLSD